MPETPSCPSCGADVPDGARFCMSCGAPVGLRTDERRVATVLFADVVGFTGLSERRDPEGVKYLLDRCFERLAADVTAYGGRVDKIVGDQLMAVFGAPIAHEDDPERAVRAALQMRRTLAEHARESGRTEIDMRTGINTGEVVVGNLRAGGDLTALGDVVNTASRLQTAAEPGQVLVGALTFGATKDVISYDALGSLAVKGRGEPVDAWAALEALVPPGSRPGRARTPIVGRKAEIGMLWHALGTAVEHRRPHLVLLVGEAGMGKTALVAEAVEIARVQHDALVMEGRCLPYGEANPWWPVAEAMREACAISADDPADVAATKCREAVARVLGAEDEGAEAGRVADGLLYLMGYEDYLADVEPSRARDEAVRAIQLCLAANARLRPLVIVLSEIHWADPLVLGLIDTMFERLRGLPIVLLATARPELEERWSPKPGRHNLFVVNLDALGRDETSQLARSLLPDDASEDLVDLVAERSGGNPLFVYELSQLLCESSTTDQHSIEVPATLRGLVAARIDALDHADRSVLEDAAVIGRTGNIETLIALAESRGESHGDTRLGALTERDLIVADDGEYEFKSDLVRDVAYETLAKAERARRHAAVAGWLEMYAKRTEREEEHVERIAHHYAVAAELVSEIGSLEDVEVDQVRVQALDWVSRAVRRAEQRETSGVSVHLLEHALDLVGDDDPKLRGEFLLGRARGLAAQREMERAHADVAATIRLAEATEDAALRARALTARGEIEQREGELTRSAATLENAVGAWREVGDRRGEAEALRLWGFTSVHRGELGAADKAISQALDISRELGDRKGEAWALQNLAWVSFSRGDMDQADERLSASARQFEAIGDVGGRAWAIGLLGYVWFVKGRLNEAGQIAEASVEFSAQLGDRWAHGMMLNLLASVRLWQGRTREALERSQEAHRLFEQINDEMGLVNSTMTLAFALTFVGRPDEGIDIGERVLPIARQIVTGGGLGAALVVMTIHALTGNGERALQVFDALRTSDEDDITGAPAKALALIVLDRYDEAYEQSALAWAEPDDPGPRANVACIHSIVCAVCGRFDEAIRAGDEVGALGGSYLDQVRAHLGRGLAYAGLGEADRTDAALASARHIVDASEDELHQAFVRLAEAVVADELGRDFAPEGGPLDAVRERLTQFGVDPQPWENAFRTAVADRLP